MAEYEIFRSEKRTTVSGWSGKVAEIDREINSATFLYGDNPQALIFAAFILMSGAIDDEGSFRLHVFETEDGDFGFSVRDDEVSA